MKALSARYNLFSKFDIDVNNKLLTNVYVKGVKEYCYIGVINDIRNNIKIIVYNNIEDKIINPLILHSDFRDNIYETN